MPKKSWGYLSLGACLLLNACQLDPRPQALRRGLDQVRSVLADPRLVLLAQKDSKRPKEVALVEALFSYEARGYWPPPLESEHNFDYSKQSKLPGRIAYLTAPDLPWSVVVQADVKQHRILLQGYGRLLDRPILNDSVAVAP